MNSEGSKFHSSVARCGRGLYRELKWLQIFYVCVCVRDGSGIFVGRDFTSDERPSYFNLLNLELCEECSRT